MLRRSGGPSEDVGRNTGTWLGCHSGLSECVRLKLHAFGASRHSCEAGGQSGFPRRSGGPSEDVGRNTGAWLGCHTGLSHWAVTLSFITAAGANDYRVCARPNCPCTRPWIDTITNKEHDFCCDSCRLGTPCTYDIHSRFDDSGGGNSMMAGTPLETSQYALSDQSRSGPERNIICH